MYNEQCDLNRQDIHIQIYKHTHNMQTLTYTHTNIHTICNHKHTHIQTCTQCENISIHTYKHTHLHILPT